MSGKLEEEKVITFGIRGFPLRCTCGRNSTIYTSKTEANSGKPFFRCPTKKDGHLFKWVEEGMYEELLDILPRVDGMQYEVEKVKSELLETKALSEEQKQEFKALTEETRGDFKAMIEQMNEELVRNKKDLQRTKLVLKCCVGLLVVITIVIVVIIIDTTTKKNAHSFYGY